MNKADNNAMNSDFEPRVYELGFLIVPSMTDENVTKAVDVLRAVIDNVGGSIIAEGAPALKELAYEMSKMIANKKSSYTSAYFGWLKYEASPETLKSIKLELDSNNDVIRYIIIKTVRDNTMVGLPVKTFQGEQSHGDDAKNVDPLTEVVPQAEKPVEENLPADKAGKEKKEEIVPEKIDEEIEKLVSDVEKE